MRRSHQDPAAAATDQMQGGRGGPEQVDVLQQQHLSASSYFDSNSIASSEDFSKQI